MREIDCVAAVENQFADKIRRAPGGFTQRHADAEKVFHGHIGVGDADGFIPNGKPLGF